MEQHNSGKPVVDQELCVGCGVCAKQCAHDAFSFNDRKASIDHNKCVGCGRCIATCKKEAISTVEDAAMENGFSPLSCGCQIIIGDGLNGADEVRVPVENGILVKEAKIGTAIMEADIVISLNHFKGHEGSGFGGAVKTYAGEFTLCLRPVMGRLLGCGLRLKRYGLAGLFGKRNRRQ